MISSFMQFQTAIFLRIFLRLSCGLHHLISRIFFYKNPSKIGNLCFVPSPVELISRVASYLRKQEDCQYYLPFQKFKDGINKNFLEKLVILLEAVKSQKP